MLLLRGCTMKLVLTFSLDDEGYHHWRVQDLKKRTLATSPSSFISKDECTSAAMSLFCHTNDIEIHDTTYSLSGMRFGNED